MAKLQEVKDAIAVLDAKVSAIPAPVPAAATEADLDDLKAAVEAVTAKVPA